LFKRTIGTGTDEDIPLYGDFRYFGIHDYHANSIIPIKSGFFTMAGIISRSVFVTVAVPCFAGSPAG